ncbi:hypothetical protein [Antheraea proylei nucleopolyhedrovirus]|uniref:Uncharacterized protein n=1 Tax=Antheraea proylei nucleopolyhedrovirus TaxID=2126611 RepID=A0A2Z6C568_NPVAP|nr:hypothetical protein [Antheraea proylei nucleopolyhedrovirus]AYW35364.1 hypothetical protein [Antheraea proylei nucleopolyhedrovirus]BBD50777.1 hypothetical protein [Antheraea proylei nucleopolyhedrovirus]
MFHFAQEYMFVSTISDVTAPLRVRVAPGDYTLSHLPGRRGFAFGLKPPRTENMVRVYATRDGHAGLSNTYHGGEIRDPALIRIVCDVVLPDLHPEALYNLFCDEAEVDAQVDHNNLSKSFELMEQQYQQKFVETDLLEYFAARGFGPYNNLPVLLFLNTPVQAADLDKLSFTASARVDGEECWYRAHTVSLDGAPIGVLVQTDVFYSMSGDQMGLATYSENGLHVHAFANFEPVTNQEYDKIYVCTY